MASPGALFASARQKRPALDHVVRAAGRYSSDTGDRLAAAVTYFGFLSFFPLLALVGAVVTLFLGDASIAKIIEQVNTFAPGLAGQLQLDKVLHSKQAAGVAGLIGLAGLLYSGLGWIDALREAIRSIWHQNVQAGNVITKKLRDILILIGLGLTLLLSVAVTAGAGAFTSSALDLVGLGSSTIATVLTKVLGIALGLATSTALFMYLFLRLPRVQSPWRRVIRGAVLAAALFEVLKLVGAWYIGRTTKNPVYGAFAVPVGLLVWINTVTRVLLLCAAWVVTAPYDTDVAPSGTADPDAAREAGMPQEYVSDDPDDPALLQKDGAPTPLVPAVEGKPAPQDEPTGRQNVPGAPGARQASDDRAGSNGQAGSNGRAGSTGADSDGADSGGAGSSGAVPVGAGSIGAGSGGTGSNGGSPQRIWSTTPWPDSAGHPLPRRIPPSQVPAVLPGAGAARAARAATGAAVVLVAGVATYTLRSIRDLVRR